MSQEAWKERTIEGFFSTRTKPTRDQCVRHALSICNASSFRPADVPGSLSYTVICSASRLGQNQNPTDTVVSFREKDSRLEEDKIRLATDVHGSLVPRATYHGLMVAAEPPLGIYTMPLLPGVACVEALGFTPTLDDEEELQHLYFVRHLARYFARCWTNAQSIESHAREEHSRLILGKLNKLQTSPSCVVNDKMLKKLKKQLPLLLSPAYPQVLTHGDLSKTNILVNEDTFEITGLIDWSLAHVAPFGMELDCLFLTTGCMSLTGWHDYNCQSQLREGFWEEFWTAAGINDENRRGDVRTKAEAAAKIGAILRYAFERNPDGSSSDSLSTSEPMLRMAAAFVGGK